MKKIAYISIFVSHILSAMQNVGIRDYTQLPIELWTIKIFPYLITTEKSGIKNYDDNQKHEACLPLFLLSLRF